MSEPPHFITVVWAGILVALLVFCAIRIVRLGWLLTAILEALPAK